MTTEPTVTNDGQALALRREDLPADRDPVTMFLGRSASEHTRRTMLSALRKVARIITGEETDPRVIPFERLRYQHTARIRACLVESGAAPGTLRPTPRARLASKRSAGRSTSSTNAGSREPPPY